MKLGFKTREETETNYMAPGEGALTSKAPTGGWDNFATGDAGGNMINQATSAIA